MKSFFRFLNEAGTSQASMQAQKLNLKSDGHGGWLDTRGNFVATTEKGKLVFKDKKKTTTQQQPVEKPAARQQPAAAQEKPKAEPTSQEKTKAQKPVGGESDSGLEGDTLTVAFGRFNPPTVGHGKLLSAAKKAASGGDLKIYPSRTQDPKKNPLDPDMKISFMKKMFPEFEENIINDDQMKSIFNVLIAADEEEYTNINIIVGSDRVAEFENLATKYNGDLYNFEMIRVISAGVRDADAEGVEGMSASKMRKAVMDDDFESFRKGTPKALDDGDTQSLFNAVRQGMGKKKTKKEVTELWQVAPKFDTNGLREHYVGNRIFRKGTLVENLNTGLIGEVIRRGTNYLICVTEGNDMFKSWIHDVMEVKEKIFTNTCGVPADQREVGTDSLRKYTMKMTDTAKIDNFNIKQFINKYKAKK